MFVTFKTQSKVPKLQVTDIPGGLRITQMGMNTLAPARIFGAGFGLCVVGSGIGMLFISEAMMPGAGPLLKVSIALALALFGGFILWAIWQNLSCVLDIDFDAAELRHFRINVKGKYKSRLTIPFSDIKGVFTEGLPQMAEGAIDHRSCLIITYRGRNGRLDALTALNGQIAALRDLILTQALNRKAAPAVDGGGAFIDRTKWELQQRMM